MSDPPEKSLYALLQEHRFHCRLQRARMIRDFPPSEERQRNRSGVKPDPRFSWKLKTEDQV